MGIEGVRRTQLAAVVGALVVSGLLYWGFVAPFEPVVRGTSCNGIIDWVGPAIGPDAHPTAQELADERARFYDACADARPSRQRRAVAFSVVVALGAWGFVRMGRTERRPPRRPAADTGV